MSEALIVDLSNYKDRTGSRVNPGDYKVQIEDIEVTKSSAKNDMIVVYLRIVGGEFDGATLLDRLVLTEKSMFRVVSFLQALNIPTPKKRIQIIPGKFLGRVFGVTVDDGEPYRGQVRSEIRAHFRIQGGKGESSAGQDLPDVDEVPDTSDDVADLEEISSDPTDYDEELEPEKVKKAKANRAKAKAAPVADDDDDYEDDEFDLEGMNL